MRDGFDVPCPSTPMLALPVYVYAGVFPGDNVDQNTLNPVPIFGGAHHVFFRCYLVTKMVRTTKYNLRREENRLVPRQLCQYR